MTPRRQPYSTTDDYLMPGQQKRPFRLMAGEDRRDGIRRARQTMPWGPRIVRVLRSCSVRTLVFVVRAT